MKSITKRIGPGSADKVYPLVKEAVLDGWIVYGQSGTCRIGCASVDQVEVYLVKEVERDGKCLLPPNDLEVNREA